MGLLLRGLIAGTLRDGRLRTIVTVVAVALGVAIALAIDLANATAVDSFSSSVNVVASRVNLQILGAGRGFDEQTLLRVAAQPGVISASPVIEDSIVVGARRGHPQAGEVLRVLGVDLLQPLPRDAGTPTTGTDVHADTLVNGQGAVVSGRVARRWKLHAGSRFSAIAGARPVSLVVAAILPPSVVGIDSSVVFVDVATAQDIFDKVGVLDRIDCVVDPNRLAQTFAAVRKIIPSGTRAVEPRVRTGEIRRMLQSFQLNLDALSAIALVVGMYLIFNTVAIAVVQRRPEIGTLRALGATRAQIFIAFLIEGGALGLAGSLLGLALGGLFAQFSVAAVAHTVQTLYIGIGVGGVLWDPLPIVKAFVLGIALAVVAAIVPALEAARIPPALTMRAAGFERASPHFARHAALAGVLAFIAAGLLTTGPPIAGLPVFGYLSGIMIIAGGSLCVPLVISGTAAFGRRYLHDAPALLAAGNLAGALRRESVAVAALGIAIAMTTAVSILIGSFRTTVVTWADEVLSADLFVRPLGPSDASSDTRFSPRVLAAIARVPGVVDVHALRSITIPFRGRLTELDATDFRQLARRNSIQFLGTGDVPALLRRTAGTRNVFVSEPFATRFGVRPRDSLVLDTPAGEIRFDVAAVFNDYSTESGIIMLDRTTFEQLFGDDTVDSIAIWAAPGANLLDLRTRVIRRVLPLQIDIETNRELRALVVQIFNRTFAITYALYLISIAIALLGVISTLFALVLERRREIGILRYLGLRTRDVRRMVLVEAAFVGVLGALVGIALGFLLALLLIFVINRQAFGWLIDLHVPWEFLGASFVVVVIAALIAGIYPAGVAARIQTVEAIRTE
ncbi:MAG TPA: FtsX-like permease family protein [Candidatus Baltobacteraceae bacterium]|jgi:putative ABC transport system permease protein